MRIVLAQLVMRIALEYGPCVRTWSHRLAGLGSVVLLGACAAGRVQTPAPGSPSRPLVEIVAAESFWGSVAAQLGGDRVHVRSVIDSPSTDPHDYEPTPADARAIASANYVIVNGVGYDAWAHEVLDANPSTGRVVLDVGDAVGVEEGDNPHRWYFPADVERVVARITADLQRLDPSAADYFDQRRAGFEAVTLDRYKRLLDEIRDQYAGTPVGASESIFTGIVEATRLDLRTPRRFLEAVSEGTDPSADDKAVVDRQIAGRAIKVFVYNSQNAVPDVAALVRACRSRGIPVVAVTESPPKDVAFQDWQTQQLQALLDALREAAPS